MIAIGPAAAWRHLELVTYKLRTAQTDGVVVGDDAVRPHLVQIVQTAIHVDQPIGKAVGALVEITVRLDESALMQVFPLGSLTSNSTHDS